MLNLFFSNLSNALEYNYAFTTMRWLSISTLNIQILMLWVYYILYFYNSTLIIHSLVVWDYYRNSDHNVIIISSGLRLRVGQKSEALHNPGG